MGLPRGSSFPGLPSDRISPAGPRDTYLVLGTLIHSPPRCCQHPWVLCSSSASKAICQLFYPPRHLGQTPCTVGLGFLGLASISQLQGTYLEDALHLDLWLEGSIPHPGTLKGSGGCAMVWRRSLSGPLFILSLIFFSILDWGRGCPEPSHKTSSWAAFSAHLPAVGMRVKFHTKI